MATMSDVAVPEKSREGDDERSDVVDANARPVAIAVPDSNFSAPTARVIMGAEERF